MNSVDIKAEINRLKAKISASTDKDIVDALEYKLAALEAQLVAAEKDEKQDAILEAAVVESKLPEEEIEKLLRFGRMQLNQKKLKELGETVSKLEANAPDHPNVLELRAEILCEKKEFQKALQLLKRARKLAPKDAHLERRLAEVAIKASYSQNFDSMMMGELSDSPFLSKGDITAGATYATIYSVFFPGAGHIVIGQTGKGITMLILWLSCISYLVGTGSLQRGLVGLFARTSSGEVGMLAIGIGFIAVMIHMIAIFECAALSKRKSPGIRIEKPKPPVNLPFD